MKLVVISHKETWCDPASTSGYATVGGFPFQMAAISDLFDQVTLAVPIQSTPLPAGAIPLAGHNLQVAPLSELKGKDLERKLRLLPWLPRHWSLLWRAVSHADAIHAPVGGDIGTIGILVALIQRKPLFVRHCGTWGVPASPIDRLLQRFLEIIAGGRNVVMATGGAESSPSRRNPDISWIFSTTLSRSELEQLPLAEPWSPDVPLHMITVTRLSEYKNVQAIISAMPAIQQELPGARLDVVGDGEYRSVLEKLVADLRLAGSVIFHGNVSHSEVLNLLSRAHLFVFPTLREGFPKAVLEALACGLPVVATRTSVIPQLLRNGCGLLLHEPTTGAVASAVLALTSDPAQIIGMSALARQAAQGYTLDAWGECIGRRLRSAWGPLRVEA